MSSRRSTKTTGPFSTLRMTPSGLMPPSALTAPETSTHGPLTPPPAAAGTSGGSASAWALAACPIAPEFPDYGYRDPACLRDAGTDVSLETMYDPYRKSERKQRDLRCRGYLKRAWSRRRVENNCKNEWTWVYRLLDPDRDPSVYYVGISDNYIRRRCEHQVPATRCQPVMVVPNRATALSVEQFLMEVYGFDNDRVINRNYDETWSRQVGWLTGKRQSLTKNLRRNFSAERQRAAYCAAIKTGIIAIHAYPPQLRGVFPPGTKLWWQNFPGRDCVPWRHVEDLYVRFEDGGIAYPRTRLP